MDDTTLHELARLCRELELVHCTFCTELTDDGVYAFATTALASKLKSLDLSFCSCVGAGPAPQVSRILTNSHEFRMPKQSRSLSLSLSGDDGVSAVAELCTNLVYLNIAGLNRVTDASARLVKRTAYSCPF